MTTGSFFWFLLCVKTEVEWCHVSAMGRIDWLEIQHLRFLQQEIVS